ncbi:hypothetical protein JCM11251_000929 [Rhodosporidiobolus azoricus]
MRGRKSTVALRSSTLPPAGTDDPFLVRSAQTPSSNAPFSSAAFDRYMMGQGENALGTAVPMAKEGSSGGLGKKLLSFPWTRSDKKHAAQEQQQIVASQPPPSPTVSSPAASPLQTTSSLPMGFPAPPPLAGPAPRAQPSQHPSVAMFAPQHPQSNSSLSTIRTTSSFASTALFASSNDGWESEATSLSLTSSPESGRDSSGEGYAPRMWRVKGLKAERSTVLSDIVERDNEDARSSGCYDNVPPPSRRNSTPVPCMVAMMLADPETPPRPKRFSTSSIKPSPTSPPFDVAYEKSAAARRRQQNAGSGGDGEEADDEVSPPRQRRSMRRDRSENDLAAFSTSQGGSSFANTARIPSIRFEGISIDAVFAEVEKKLNKEMSDASIASFGSSASEKKAARRRSRVLSMYKPTSPTTPTFASPPAAKEQELPTLREEPFASTSSLSSIAESGLSRTSSSLDLLRSESVTPTATSAAPILAPLDAPRPRPWPRRTSSRPSPLNVAAANAITTWGIASAPLQAAAPLYSPTAHGAFSPVPYRSMPMQLVSPPLAGAFSPSSPANSLSPTSPSLGEAFNPEPSPALSTASTFRPYDIPELLVCPPSPTQEEIDHTRQQEQQRKERRASAATVVQGQTRVTVVHEKRMVRVSTRAPSRRQDRRTYVSPPLQQQATFSAAGPSSRPSSPAPTFDPSPSWDVKPLAATPPTPTVVISPSFDSEPYNPPAVARTDFHPALSSLSVEQPHGPITDDDSSDCEESLHNMLMRLNRPHTPPDVSSSASSATEEPAPSNASPSSSLTELALELHNTSQSRLSMLARAMSPTASSSCDTKENRSPSPVGLAISAPTSKQSRRLSKLYESDDSAAMQFGALRQQEAGNEDDDEPLQAMLVTQPLSPSMTHHSFALQSLHGEHGGRNFSSSSEEGDGEEGRFGELETTLPYGEDEQEEEPLEDDVDIESEIDKTLASIVGSASQSTFSSSSSSDPATSSSLTSRKNGHRQQDSTSSFGSVVSVDEQDKADGQRRFLPRSESLSSQLTDSSFDSAEAMDEAIVCLGERINYNYDVGVIGMAM